MILILYKITNIFNKYVLIFHKLTLSFYWSRFARSFLKHSSVKQKLIIYSRKFVIEGVGAVFLTNLFSVG